MKWKERTFTQHEVVELLHELGEQVDSMQNKLHLLRNWSEAYPIDVFPEPDFKKVQKALEDNRLSLDAVSASNMRHVISGVKDILNQ